MKKALLALPALLFFLGLAHAGTLEKLQLDYLNLRFGMFIHYNMSTYHNEEWAKPNHELQSFAPSALDCDQWAAAAKSAGMTYAVLTTKHHDGFCLWPTATTPFNVANTPCKVDVVKRYADAFRRQGLKVGLYFSIMDWTHGIDKQKVTPEKIALIKAQLTELLTGYGDVLCIVFDGWASAWGGPSYQEVPYGEIYALVKQLQPGCLIINHDGVPSLEHSDVVHYEETFGQWAGAHNRVPSQQGPVLVGPDEDKNPAWFWKLDHPGMACKSVDWVVNEHLRYLNARNCNLLLNVSPNREGRLDANIISRLKEIGAAWKMPPPQTALRTINTAPPLAAASSTAAGPHSPQNVVDENFLTGWQAADGDREPTLTLSYPEAVSFDHFHLRLDSGEKKIVAAELQARVGGQWVTLYKTDNQNWRGVKASDGRVTPTKTNELRLRFRSAKPFLVRDFFVYQLD